MTDARRSPVDLDLLSDYACGALVGTPEHDRVAALIRTDADWATDYRAVTAADPLVRGQLAALGAEPTTMPADVLARITTALAAERRVPEGAPAPATGEGQVRHLDVARRRRRRIAGWTSAAAAAVVILAAIGLVGTGQFGSAGKGSVSSGPNQADQAAPSREPGKLAPNRAPSNRTNAADSGPPVPLAVSGSDYTPATLPEAARVTGSTTLDDATSTRIPTPLDRLAQRRALDVCLTAVEAREPGTPRVVDYARFQTNPALIVVLTTDDAGATLIVVAAPSCGAAGAGIRFQTAS